MPSSGPRLIALIGPTASGKTETALALARRFDASILSADSMQVYRGMDIGTAKPTWEERREVPHYLIDVADPKEFFSVSDFRKRAVEVIEDHENRRSSLIVCGGTGLYFKALFEGLAEGPPPDEEFRADMERIALEKGASYLHGRLAQVDPESAELIHPNDLKRIVRALEIPHATGSTKRDLQALQEHPAFSERVEWFGILPTWEALDRRIEERVDRMFEAGLVEEAQRLMAEGCSLEHTSMQALGYKETFAYLSGETGLAETEETIKKRTKRFARRQMRWFRSWPNVFWRDPAVSPSESRPSINWILDCLA